MKKKIMIVEDDIYISSDLEQMLIELNYSILPIAHTVKDALNFIKKEQPDLILMDIDLSDALDGVQLSSIIKTEYKIPIIFTTAFSDQTTMDRVKNISPYGYIVKPYTKETIKVSLEMAFFRLEQENKLISPSNEKSVFINSSNGNIQINIDEIIYIGAYDYYANIFLEDKKILVKMTLKEILDQIQHPNIIRVHKSFAVNIKKINKIKNSEIILGEATVPIGRVYKEELKKHIKII